MKLASAASLTELINGAENLTKNPQINMVLCMLFLESVCVIYISIYLYLYIYMYFIFFLFTVSFKNNHLLLEFLVLATADSFCKLLRDLQQYKELGIAL